VRTNPSSLNVQPDTTPVSLEPVDVRAHFALHSLPFTRELSINKRFVTSEFTIALSRLKQAIDGHNLTLLAGPAGCGKSVLLRSLRAARG